MQVSLVGTEPMEVWRKQLGINRACGPIGIGKVSPQCSFIMRWLGKVELTQVLCIIWSAFHHRDIVDLQSVVPYTQRGNWIQGTMDKTHSTPGSACACGNGPKGCTTRGKNARRDTHVLGFGLQQNTGFGEYNQTKCHGSSRDDPTMS